MESHWAIFQCKNKAAPGTFLNLEKVKRAGGEVEGERPREGAGVGGDKKKGPAVGRSE